MNSSTPIHPLHFSCLVHLLCKFFRHIIKICHNPVAALQFVTGPHSRSSVRRLRVLTAAGVTPHTRALPPLSLGPSLTHAAMEVFAPPTCTSCFRSSICQKTLHKPASVVQTNLSAVKHTADLVTE